MQWGLPKSCQQWKLLFLPTVAFRATKIPTTLTADVPVVFRATKDLLHAMLPFNYWSCQRWFSELPKFSRCCLCTIAFRATKILSTVGFDIPADYSFQTYQNPANSGRWHSCRLLFSELLKTWKTQCFPSTVGVDNLSY